MFKTVVLATGVALTLSVAAQSAAAAPSATAGAFQPSGDVPVDWSALVDDTLTIAIRVPSVWTAVDLTPQQLDDGPQPWISATTDESLFFPPPGTADTFGVPGVVYRAATFDADTAGLLADSMYDVLCTPGAVQTYDDGLFAGHIQFYDNCGGTAARIVRVAANPGDAAFTLRLLVQLTGQPDDDATLDGLLSSFTRVDDASVSTTSTDAAAPATSVVVNDPLMVVQQLLQDELGLTITDEQARCLLDSDVDATDQSSVMAALFACGVDLLDIPAG